MILENVSMNYRMKVLFYISLFTIAQYFLCLTNWNKFNSPQSMPVPFNEDVRGVGEYEHYIKPPLPLPWVDMITTTEIWKKYLMIDKNEDILHSLMLETVVICLSSIYFYVFSPYLYNVKKSTIRQCLKVKSDLGKNEVFLDYVQSSSIFATIYKGIKSILYNT